MAKNLIKTPVKLSSDVEDKIVDKIVSLAQVMGEVKFYPYQVPFARRLTQSIITNEGATLTALFSRQCIAEDSLILDRNGHVLPIQKHPNAWKTKDSADIWEIKTMGGHVIHCTAEHPIATPEGYVSAFCLTKGDKVIVLDKWDKFGNGQVPFSDGRSITINTELAELLGWLTAYIKEDDEVKVIQGKARVVELLDKYFAGATYRTTKNQAIIKLDGALLSFLKAMRFNSSGFPENLNYFSESQLVSFFAPIFLLKAKAYKKPTTVKFALKGDKRWLEFAKEHLNKLGIHGNYETWIGPCLIFQCQENYLRIKELFEWFLGEKWFPLMYIGRRRIPKVFIGEDGEELIESRIHSVRQIGTASVWDTEIPDKGWFLCSGAKVHNSGKTQVVAMITAACMVILPSLADKFPENFGLFSKGLWAGCFGPVGEQAVTMFDRIYSVFTTDTSKKLFIEELKMPIPAQGGARGNLIKLKNKSFVRYMSSSKRAKVESKTYHLIILDECQDMDSFKVKKSIMPMGAAVNATVVATGTPDIYIGFFYDTIEQNKQIDLDTRSDKQLHFEVDYTIAQRYNPMYKKYVTKEKNRLLEDSDEFKMAYRLIWPITKGMVFTKAQLEEKAYDKSMTVVKKWLDSPCIAGLDLGKSQDSTVVTIIRPDWNELDPEGNMPKTLLDWLEIEGDEWEKQYPQVVDFLSNYNVETLVCDSTGVGDPIREHYAVLLPKVNVVPFIFSPTTKDIGYKYLIQEINSGRLTIPAHAQTRATNKFKKFELQMTTIKKHYSGKFLSPCPVDQEKGHDDFPDSLMLAVFGTYFDIMPEIDIDDNDIYKAYRRSGNELGKHYSTIISEGVRK